MLKRLALNITKALWSIGLTVSFFVIIFPQSPLLPPFLLGLFYIFVDYFFAPNEVTRKQSRKLNIILAAIILPLICFWGWQHLIMGSYSLWHIPAFGLVLTELGARVYLIFKPNEHLPAIFYPPRSRR